MAIMGRIFRLLLPLMFFGVQTSSAVSMKTMESGRRTIAVWTNNVKGKSMNVEWNRSQPSTDYSLTVSSENGTVVYDHLTDTLLTLTGLSPNTVYSLSLRDEMGDSIALAETVQSTSCLQFDELPCKALTATDITPTSFVARWQTVPGAQRYLVNVCERRFDSTTTIKYGFPNDGSSLPAGWSSTSKSLSRDYYGESGVYSLRMPKNKDSLLIVAQGDSLIQGLRFWWSGNQSGNSLSVRALDSEGHWTTSGVLNTIEGKDSIADFSFDNAYAVSISFNRKSSGFACIDDVSLTVSTPDDHPVEGMSAIDAGQANEFAVCGLRAGTQYSYRVYAAGSGQQTEVSEPVLLQTLIDPTAIATVDVSSLSGPVCFYDLAGRRVNYATAPAGIYIVRKGGKTYKVMKR